MCCQKGDEMSFLLGGNMAFGKREIFTDDLLEYAESVDMLLLDMKSWGWKNLTKEKLNFILQNEFSIGNAVRKELDRICDLIKINMEDT
jgi:hypothetical protein